MPGMSSQGYSPCIKYHNLETLIELLIEVKEVIPANEMRHSSADYFIERFALAMQQKALKDMDQAGIAKWTRVLQGETKFLLPNSPESVALRKKVENEAKVANGINPFQKGSTDYAIADLQILQRQYKEQQTKQELEEVVTPDLASWIED